MLTKKQRIAIVKVFSIFMAIVSIISLVLLISTIWTGLRLLSIGNEIGNMEYTNTVSLFYWTPDKIQHYEELIAKRQEIYNSPNKWVSFVATAPNWAQLLIPTVLFFTFIGGLVMYSGITEILLDEKRKIRK